MKSNTDTIGSVLRVEQVGVNFGGLAAIIDMSFTVQEGELVALIGPNGAGKTTAFNVMTGFLRPSTGTVYYKDFSLTGLTPHEVAALGLIRTFQRTSVFANKSVFENVLIGLHRQGRSTLLDTILGLPSERRSEQHLSDRAWSILQTVGLADRAGEFGGALAYGEQRLLGVALALAADPSMLLLDEPVSGMNPAETSKFMQLLRRIREGGVTILLVEHDMTMVMGVSDRVLVLDHGAIIAEGLPSEIQRDPVVIEAYLGQGVRRARGT